MDITFQHLSLPAERIQDRWLLKNVLIGGLNNSTLPYKVCRSPSTPESSHAVFYMPGLGGSLDDTPFLEDHICHRHSLIRVPNFGLSDPLYALITATFGDGCAILHNAAAAVSTIASDLGLKTYDIVAHSWGGMVATINALRDKRCRKAMLLVSSPDICDAVEHMYFLNGVESFTPFLDIFKGHLRGQARAAKFGKSVHQDAWENISPFRLSGNPGLEMLIFNREEDRVMRKENVEHFIRHSKARGLDNITAEFIQIPGMFWHDMPLQYFSDRMAGFLRI